MVCFNVRLGALRCDSPDSETSKFIKAVKTVMDISHKEFMKLPLYKWINTPMFNRMTKAQDVIRMYVLFKIYVNIRRLSIMICKISCFYIRCLI